MYGCAAVVRPTVSFLQRARPKLLEGSLGQSLRPLSRLEVTMAPREKRNKGHRPPPAHYACHLQASLAAARQLTAAA